MSAVTIVPAGPRDIDSLLPLLQHLFSLEADFQFDKERARTALQLLLADGQRSQVMLAKEHERIVGMCSAQLVISTAEGGYSAWVEDVVVLPDFQGRGIGPQLLAALQQWCRERGARRMQLLADRENLPALGFYRKLGWADTQLQVLRKG